MATIFLDGFDKYGPIGETSPTMIALMEQSEWTTNSGSTITCVAGLSSTGRAVKVGPQGNALNAIQRTLGSNITRSIGGCRFAYDCRDVVGLVFTDSATDQCTLGFIATGQIRVYTGSFSTTLATSNAAVVPNSIHYLEWDIAIGPAGSAFTIYLDGIQIITGTGITRVSANSFFNVFKISCPSTNSGGGLTIDDLYLFDTTGATNNAVLRTNPRIETRYPNSDSQTQWTNSGNVLVPAGLTATAVSTATSTTFSTGTGSLNLLKVTPAVNCTLQTISILAQTTSLTVRWQGALYADSAGAPAALLASGNIITGSTSGSAVVMTFGAGQALTGGTSYWIGGVNDTTAINVSAYDSTSNLANFKASVVLGSLPNPAGAVSTLGTSFLIWGNATGATTNRASVANNPAPGTGASGDSSSIFSNTVANEDLYGFPALSTTISNVYTVAVKAHLKRSDSGARTVDMRLKSNLTDSPGSSAGQTPGTTYGWVDSYFETDPNGPTAWTRIGVNAATAGPKIAS